METRMKRTKEPVGNNSFLGRSLSRRSVLQIGSAFAAADGPVFAQEQETTWKRVLRTQTIRVGTIGTTKTSKVNLDGSFTRVSPGILRQALKPHGVTPLVPVQSGFARLI